MYQGKAKCELLKEIRSQIATQNGIDYETSDCSFEGDCKGTCPKCEAELKFIENQLIHRKKSGKSVLISGITAGIITTMMSSCQDKPNPPIPTDKTQKDTVQVDMILKDTNLTKNKKNKSSENWFIRTICTEGGVGLDFEVSEGFSERIPDTIDIIENIPDPFPPDSTIFKIDTL